MSIEAVSGRAFTILIPTTVLLLGFFGRAIHRCLYKSLSETNVSERRNAISDALIEPFLYRTLPEEPLLQPSESLPPL
jgi:hypothetical protein